MTVVSPNAADLAALLQWYGACGVDLALDDAPHDRFKESARAPQAVPAMAPPPEADPVDAPHCDMPAPARVTPAAPSRAAAPIFPEEALRAAQEAAAGAQTLDELRASLEAFAGCGFKALAQHFVFAAGAPGARVMALDFAPGESEDRGGVAFSGPEAALLDKMLAAIRRDRSSAYLAYFSPWRPPGYKTAPPHEIAALAPFARRHVALAKPDVLLLLGDAAARAMLATNEAPSRLYGKWQEIEVDGARIAAMPLPAPAALLSVPSMKRNAWAALRAAAKRLG
jgi:uracil-DNA glycosylase family 4